MLYHQALAAEHDMPRALVYNLGMVASTLFFFFFSFLVWQQLAPLHKPHQFRLYRLPSLFLVPEILQLVSTGIKNCYRILVSVFWYQNLVSVSGTYVT